MQDIMTPEQVANFLQLAPDTVYRLIRQHKLGAARIGRSYRIPKEDVELFITTNSNRAQVRKALFKHAGEIRKRNVVRYPHLSSDDVLKELEEVDANQQKSVPKKPVND